MNIKQRLTALNFLEFAVWGSWLLTTGGYAKTALDFTGVQIGSLYATLGIASVFMPPLLGIVADKWMDAKKVFSLCHLALGIAYLQVAQSVSYSEFYFYFLIGSLLYMPTLGLNNAMCYAILEKNALDPIKVFPKIRVWGTVGFILAAWTVDFLDMEFGKGQFYLAAILSVILAIYTLTLPKIPPSKTTKKSWTSYFGLDAFSILKQRKLLIFLCYSILIGAALQITNIWGVPFLNDFKLDYPDSFVVKNSVLLVSLSQISEVFFILAIPYFLKRFGIKKVVLLSTLAWVFRFGLFAIGGPEGMGLVFIIASMIIYGMAFDFYFISGSLYINENVDKKISASAQGLYMTAINGLGAIVGAYASGYVIDFFVENDRKQWPEIWMLFAFYALVIGIIFLFVFKDKPKKTIL